MPSARDILDAERQARPLWHQRDKAIWALYEQVAGVKLKDVTFEEDGVTYMIKPDLRLITVRD